VQKTLAEGAVERVDGAEGGKTSAAVSGEPHSKRRKTDGKCSYIFGFWTVSFVFYSEITLGVYTLKRMFDAYSDTHFGMDVYSERHTSSFSLSSAIVPLQLITAARHCRRRRRC
jgi:hypothetical protein